MFRSRSEPVLAAVMLALAAGPFATGRAAAQDATAGNTGKIVSSQVSISRNEARLGLEFTDGRRSEFAIHDGRAWVDGNAVGDAARGSDLDRSWRNLLNEAIEADGPALAALLIDWEAPGGAALDAALESAVRQSAGRAIDQAADAGSTATEINVDIDSVRRMTVRLRELQQRLNELESADRIPLGIEITRRSLADRGGWIEHGPFRHVFRGISGILRWALVYGVVFAIAFATIYFGGRRYIETVADTARSATTRSLLIGLAASFLIIPAWILGMLALAISIVGIPALIAWVPLFPVAVGLAVLLGYIAVAHATGEALAERRFYATDWFQRGNSYYFLMTGLGVLVAPFVIVNVFRMAGPWLGFIGGIFFVVGAIMTWAALSIGLGAVLLTRGGTRPGPGARPVPEPGIYAEPTGA